MVKRRHIVVFTGNRAEYGLLHPVIRALVREPSIVTSLIVSGSHLVRSFGATASEIDLSGLRTVKRILLPRIRTSSVAGTLCSFSAIVGKAPEVLSELRPDIVVLAGDRSETFAMAIASFYANKPIAHLFGGDLSQGGHLDDSVRHSITKLAHLHFTTNRDSYRRVLSLGEERRRVFNVGSPAVENACSGECAEPGQLARELEIDLKKPVILFTQHPVTTESDQAYRQARESLAALEALGHQTVITYPCNDAGSAEIIRAIRERAGCRNFRIRESLGWKRYLGLLKIAACVVGNSSSGIIESPIFKVPCVNIGTRQKGRLRAGNVIDVPHEKKRAIMRAVEKAMGDARFRAKVRRCSNPYGSGRSSEKIVKVLRTIPLGQKLLQKRMTL